jgi:predicted ribosomally synthesized peptide with SipW-like signal peptide
MKKNTKRTLVATLLVMLLSLTVLIGSTYAYFNDVVNGTGSIKTGTIDTEVKVLYTEAQPDDAAWTAADVATDDAFSFSVQDYKPGDFSTIWFRFENVGTLTYDLVFKMKATNGDATDICSQFRYKVTVVTADVTKTDMATEATPTTGIVNKVATVDDVRSKDDVAAKSVVIFKVEIRMIDSDQTFADGGDLGRGDTAEGEQSGFADNEFANLSDQNQFMNKTITFDFNIEALQNTGVYYNLGTDEVATR